MNASISTPSVLHPDVINLDLAARTAPEAFTELSDGLSHRDGMTDPARFLSDLLARQAMGGNCLDLEIALPHVRTPAMKRIVLAVGRSHSGVWFDPEHPAIRLIFLIGVPTGATTEYLRWVALLARALRRPGLRQGLLAAPTAEAFREVWSPGIRPAKP